MAATFVRPSLRLELAENGIPVCPSVRDHLKFKEKVRGERTAMKTALSFAQLLMCCYATVFCVATPTSASTPLTLTNCLPSQGDHVTNVWQMSADFALAGWLLEDFPDTRPGGAPDGRTHLLAPLVYVGTRS